MNASARKAQDRPAVQPIVDLAALALAAADVSIATRHARGLELLLDELGHRGASVAARHVAERLERSLQMLARV